MKRVTISRINDLGHQIIGNRRIILLTLVGSALLGISMAASGIIPIKASSGHWPITRWFLHFSMQRSAKFHSRGIEVPNLDQPHLVLQGAGHYEFACRPCHGSPGSNRPLIPALMAPHPPDLTKAVEKWDAKGLFYVVKHGIKFTGMPAWPSQERDDEVWGMVAFLKVLPELGTQEYQKLAYGEQPAPEHANPLAKLSGTPPRLVLDNCARCHGLEGSARGDGAFPNLPGQKATYLYNTLKAYADGKRHSGTMQPLAAALDDSSMRMLADYYSKQPLSTANKSPNDPSSIERGELIARHGIPSRKIPSCADCHGPFPTRINEAYPILTGQRSRYLVNQLKLFQNRQRGGSEFGHLMHHVVGNLSPPEMEDLAHFYESLTEN